MEAVLNDEALQSAGNAAIERNAEAALVQLSGLQDRAARVLATQTAEDKASDLSRHHRQVTIENAIRAVAAAHGLTPEAVRRPGVNKRRRHISLARGNAAWVLRRAGLKWKEVAEALRCKGGDHTQAVQAAKRWEKHVAESATASTHFSTYKNGGR